MKTTKAFQLWTIRD